MDIAEFIAGVDCARTEQPTLAMLEEFEEFHRLPLAG